MSFLGDPMTTYARLPGTSFSNDINTVSDLILEGEIEYVYSSIMPLSKPDKIGIHVLFKKDNLKKIYASDLGDLLFQSFPYVGFWMLDTNEFKACVGQRIRVALRQDTRAPFLMFVKAPHYRAIIDLNNPPTTILGTETPTLCRLPSNFFSLLRPLLPLFPVPNPVFGTSDLPLIQAAAIWNKSGANMKVQVLFATGVTQPNSVYPIVVPSLEPDTLAHAYPCNIPTSMLEFSAEFNWSLDASACGPNQYHLLTCLLHEIGHCLGLGHSEDPNSIMFWSQGRGEIRSPTSEDYAALVRLYGNP
ncbi:MAG: matrixin family metalloprotease [Proteobacteria bacterium]|nr:MAG: matrixin family metalloprotease [Pseudomonadota bacterium]